jgi:NADH-quinone oxidoreductase subunit L
MEIVLLFFPLLASIISGFFGKFIGDRISEIVTSLFVSISAIISLILFYNVIVNNYENNVVIATWINSGTLNVNWSIKIDALSSVMLVVVTLVSSLVHIYSIGYMSHDPHKPRFMAYLSLFTFSMLTLVTSDNFLQLFFGWEGVGLCSYFLIGFWFKRDSANAAAIKAFIVNRVGDFGFALGIFLIFYLFGTVNYSDVFQLIPGTVDKEILFLGIYINVIDLICMLLFIGAMGKSAQIFLHTWLPDAMEGPTPVSALIHAATMVTAGVFLVVRCSPIFEYSPLTLNIITIIGMTTAFFAATVALVQSDIKKIIAYSTCSQLGYMFFAAGVGAYNVAMFHLFTHAFFKALLFLGSGSVIHSFNDEQNINQMGAVYKKLPYTWILMIIGTLALTGFPFLSGFYSKDAIIEFAYLKGNTSGYYAAGIGIFTALLTSIYSWRLIFKTFHGTYNNKKIDIEKIHESPMVMLVPLIILAIGSIFAGFLFKDLFIDHNTANNFWGESIKFLKPLSTEHPPLWFMLSTPVLVVLSIPFSYYFFVKNKEVTDELSKTNKPIYDFLVNKWYFDEIYNAIFIQPSKKIGLFFWKVIDVKIIDRFGPDGISLLIKNLSIKASKFQSGFIYQYAFMILVGFSALLTFLILN